MFMKNIAYKTKSLVVHLQTVELNILDASGLVEATSAVLSLQQFYRKQLREVLDILTSRMSEHLANARRVFCRC